MVLIAIVKSPVKLTSGMLIATVPLIAWAIFQFGSGAVLQLLVCVGGCVAAEIGFTAMRGRCPIKAVKDISAIVTGVILALHASAQV